MKRVIHIRNVLIVAQAFSVKNNNKAKKSEPVIR